MKSGVVHISRILPLILAVYSCSGTADAPTAQVDCTVSIPEALQTESARVAFYSNGAFSGSWILQKDIESAGFSGRMNLRMGLYDVVCYNFDIPDTFVKGDDNISSVCFYTGEPDVRVKRYFALEDSEKVFHTPDKVMFGLKEGLEVKEDNTGCHIDARPITENWNIRIKVDGIQYVSSASILIDGMLPECHPCNTELDGESSYIWTKLDVGTAISGQFNCFGPAGDRKEHISLSVLDTQGKPYIFEMDCADAMAEARRNGDFTNAPEGSVVVPEPEDTTGTGGGFQPTIGEWNYRSGKIII